MTPGPRAATAGDVIEALEHLYPLDLAEAWDRVGLTVGSRSAPVRRILYTVDVTREVVEEAVALGANLLVAHHPLLLRSVNEVDVDTPKGRLVAELLRHDTTLYTAHTNADVPAGGVADSLGAALGLEEARPLLPGRSGGLGRVGAIPGGLTLGTFVRRVAEVLPGTGGGIRVSGDWDQPISTVALQAGAGDDLLAAARAAGADVYLTSDLRHHPASEARAHDAGPALVDVAHWAAESLWLPVVRRLVAERLLDRGVDLPADISTVCTDPWNHRV